MEYLPLILTVATVHLLAVMSPGPDFILISRNSLVYSRQSGIYSAIGLGLGILLHVSYCLVGIGLLIAQSVLLFTLMKFLGAAYLIYIGYKSLRAKPAPEIGATAMHKIMTKTQAIKMGFITNATNPKATLFFLSLFTLIITPETPLGVKLFMGAEMAIATAAWFSLVAVMLSHHLVKRRFAKIQHYAERAMGVILIGLGLKLAATSSK